MTEVLVERNWEEPLTDADMQIMFSNALGCLNIHRVDWSGSLLSADGRDLFCHYSAADAESARIALQQAGSPRGHVWAGSVHDAPGFTNDVLARANVLVSRRFEAPVGLEESRRSSTPARVACRPTVCTSCERTCRPTAGA